MTLTTLPAATLQTLNQPRPYASVAEAPSCPVSSQSELDGVLAAEGTGDIIIDSPKDTTLFIPKESARNIHAYGESRIVAESDSVGPFFMHDESHLTVNEGSAWINARNEAIISCGTSWRGWLQLCDSSTGTVSGSGLVVAKDDSSITAGGSVLVEAAGRSRVVAFDKVGVTASHHADVTLQGRSWARVNQNVVVRAGEDNVVLVSQPQRHHVTGGRLAYWNPGHGGREWAEMFGLPVDEDGQVSVLAIEEKDAETRYAPFAGLVPSKGLSVSRVNVDVDELVINTDLTAVTIEPPVFSFGLL